jgi:hypothetical protein
MLSIVLALLMIFPAFAAIYHPVINGQVESPPLPLANAGKGGATFSDPIVTSTVVNQNTEFSLKWTDTVRIMGYIFSFDSGSGTFVNDSVVAVNSTSVWTNTTKPINGSPGEKIGWAYYVEDNNSVWSKSYTYSFVAGEEPSAVSFANFRLITDDSYDLLAYDGTNFANLGNFPQLVGTYGSETGFREVVWNPQATMAIAVGYNNSAILYTRSTGTITVLSTGASEDTDLDGIAWMPNGTSAIITGTNPDVILTYSTQYRNFTVVPNPTGITGLGSVAWNPASNYAIITASNGLLKYSSNGVLSTVPSAAGVSTSSIDFNPNGTMAMLTGQGGNLFKYTSAQSNLTYIGTIPGVTQLQQIRFSRDGAYALISAQPGSAGDDLYRYDGANVYAVSTGINTTATGISFSPDDSYAIVDTSSGGLLTESYNTNSATLATLTPNSGLYGVGFLPPAIVTTTTTTTTTTSPNALASISINTNNGTLSAGNPINISGRTLTANGTIVPSQAIYIWVNGKVQGSATSNSSGYWSYSFTPSTNGTYYVAASQNGDGSGVTSSQLALSVSPATTTTTTTTSHSTTSSSPSNQTTSTTTTTHNSSSGNSSTTQTTSTTTSSNTTTTTTSVTTSTNTTSVQTTTTTSNTTSSTSTSITPTQSLSSTNSSSATSTTTNSTIIQTSESSTNSTTSSQGSNGQQQQQTSWVALFTTIPYVTTSSPSAGGSAIFACYVGIVVSIPFIVRKLRKRAQEGGSTHDWRW